MTVTPVIWFTLVISFAKLLNQQVPVDPHGRDGRAALLPVVAAAAGSPGPGAAVDVGVGGHPAARHGLVGEDAH